MSSKAASLAGRAAILATMHGKEAAFAGPLETLGLTVETLAGFDTDRFGTFSGEIARTGDMLEAARAKAQAALAQSGREDALVIASEGAFGPHPAVPLLPGGCELVVLIDPRTGLELTETRISFETNNAVETLEPGADPSGFLDRIGFPDHAVIVRAGETVLAKGVQTRAALDGAIQMAGGRPIQLETDMRAHLNPTRMAEIGALAKRLADRLATPCPACASPGFGRVGAKPGLPCSACATPTGLVARERFACPACAWEEVRPRSDGRQFADPGDCPACNP